MNRLDSNVIAHQHDNHYKNMVFHIESMVLDGRTAGEDLLAQIPAEYIQKSPILLKLQGESLMRRGALLEAGELLLSAVQGFTRQTFQTLLLDTLAQLAMVYLRLAEWQDAKTILHFLKEERQRKECRIGGRVLQSLAWGCYLLNEVGSEETYVRGAWEQFKQDGDTRGIIDLCLDLLLYWGAEMSEQERWKIYYYAEQKAKLNPEYVPVRNLASGLILSHQLQWGEAVVALENVDTAQMCYHHASLCLIRHLEARLQAYPEEQSAHWDALHHVQRTYTSDLILQFQLGALQYTQAELKGDGNLSDALLYKLMAWQELTRNPRQADWLQWLQMKKETAAAGEGQKNGWEIRCFGSIVFTRAGTEIKGLTWKRKKALELFIYLLIQPNYAAPKEQIMETILGQGYADKMNNQLYVILHQLKQTLSQQLNIEPNVIIKDGIIRLHKGQIQSLDLEQYQGCIQEGDQLWSKDQEFALPYYEQALSLYGEFVPEIRYIDWVDEYRETLADIQAAILRKVATYYKELEQHEQAEALFNKWIELSPADEDGYREFIEYLSARGRKQEAKRVRKRWEKLILEEEEAASPN